MYGSTNDPLTMDQENSMFTLPPNYKQWQFTWDLTLEYVLKEYIYTTKHSSEIVKPSFW